MGNRDLVLKQLHAATEAIAVAVGVGHSPTERELYARLAQAHAVVAVGYMLLDIEFTLRDLDRLVAVIEEHS
jgi:hypothetical protein